MKYTGTASISIDLSIPESTPLYADDLASLAVKFEEEFLRLVNAAANGDLFTRRVWTPVLTEGQEPSPIVEHSRYDMGDLSFVVNRVEVDTDDLHEHESTWRVVLPLTYTIEGEYTVEVDATDESDARHKAEDEVPYSYEDVDSSDGDWDESDHDVSVGRITNVEEL